LAITRRNRCVHDIVYDILTVLSRNGEMCKTALCLSANLPVDRCNRILKLLEANGLIRREPDERVKRYRICERGYVYLGLYVKVHEILLFPKPGGR